MNTTNTNQEDKEMAMYIMKVLSMRKITLMSWGFNSPKVITDGLQFEVNGFKHSGLVNVIYQHGLDLFKICLLSKEMELVKELTEIYFDELVSTIDKHVEMVENYEERVKLAYSKSETHSNDECIQINLN
jgi:alpha-N-acetylglucosamine transferase